MAQKPLEEIAWMKRLIEIAFFLRGGAVPRDSKTHRNGLHQPGPSTFQVPSTAAPELLRSAQKYIDLLSQSDLRNPWHLPVRVWLWRFADSQKKACPTDSPRKWCKLGLICSKILYKSSRFAHPLNPLQDSSSLSSSTPLRTPSLGCASEGAGYRFPVLVQGHRAHAAPIANAKAAAGAVHGCGTPRAPETRRLHRWRGWWLRRSSRSSRKMWRGDSWIIMGEYKWRIVRKNWGISIWRNLMKLIRKLVSNDARSMSKHLKEGKFSSGKACWISFMVKKCAADRTELTFYIFLQYSSS